MLHLARLHRLDAALIAFGSFWLGAGVAAFGDARAWLAGASLSLISFNFIYSFNAWTDRKADAVNKPERPIPAGQVSAGTALRYSLVLLVLSCLVPFVLASSWVARALWLALPILGLAYSAEPLRLKRRILTASPAIGLMYVIPAAIGLSLRADGFTPEQWALLGACFGLTVFTVPLKDVGDERGDALDGCDNWKRRLGPRRLYAMSTIGLLATAAWSAFGPWEAPLRLLFAALPVSAAAVLLAHRLFKADERRIYPRILQAIMVEGIVFFLWRGLP